MGWSIYIACEPTSHPESFSQEFSSQWLIRETWGGEDSDSDSDSDSDTQSVRVRGLGSVDLNQQHPTLIESSFKLRETTTTTMSIIDLGNQGWGGEFKSTMVYVVYVGSDQSSWTHLKDSVLKLTLRIDLSFFLLRHNGMDWTDLLWNSAKVIILQWVVEEEEEDNVHLNWHLERLGLGLGLSLWDWDWDWD